MLLTKVKWASTTDPVIEVKRTGEQLHLSIHELIDLRIKIAEFIAFYKVDFDDAIDVYNEFIEP